MTLRPAAPIPASYFAAHLTQPVEIKAVLIVGDTRFRHASAGWRARVEVEH